MKSQLPPKIETGLLEVKIKAIRSLIDKKLANSKLFIRIADQSSSAIFNLAERQVKLQEIRMFQCTSLDSIQLQYNDDKSGQQGQLRFPLKKLTQMPRVKHCIEAVLMKKIEKNKRTEQNLKIERLLSMDLQLVYLNAIQGKFTIQTIEIQLTRNTQMVGQMDPYAILDVDGQRHVTHTKKNQGRLCVWTEKIQFQIKNSGKSTLKMRIFDKDPLKDDLVCQCQILLLKEGLLFASQKTKEKQFSLLFDQKSAGIVKLQYQFDILPFNF